MKPSVALAKFSTEITGEHKYVGGLFKSHTVAVNVRDGMNSHFGAALIAALDNLERAAYSRLSSISPWRWRSIAKAQIELRTSQYIKAILMSYVTNVETLEEQIKELYGDFKDE